VIRILGAAAVAKERVAFSSTTQLNAYSSSNLSSSKHQKSK
jgi:hypothetical protein